MLSWKAHVDTKWQKAILAFSQIRRTNGKVRPKASWAGLICRTDQYFQPQRLPYTCHRFNSVGCVYIKQEAMLSCFRLQVNAQWVSSACSHTSIKNTLQKIVSVYHKQCDRIIPRYMFDRNYVVEIPNRSDWIGNNVDLYSKQCRLSGQHCYLTVLIG